MKKNLLLFSLVIGCTLTAAAQSLAVNTDGSAAAGSALLDIKSADKGVLIPRMSKTERNTVASPATGLLVFQHAPDSIGFYFFSGSKWLWLTNADYTDTLAWKRTGNAGTNADSHFVGTTDDRPLRLRINNLWAGEIDSAKRSVLLGLGAGQNTGSGTSSNIAIGNASQKNNSLGSGNITIGDSALYTTTTGSNDLIAIGNKAMYNNTSGLYNTAIGDSGLYSNTVGVKNTVLGYGAALSNLSGDYNTAAGYRSLYSNTTGFANTALGHVAGFSNTGSHFQVAIGDSALYSNTGFSHSANIAIGAHAATYNPGPVNCIYIGFRSGWKSNGGFGSIYMGPYAGENASGNQNIGIGQQALRNNKLNFNVAVGVSTLELNSAGNRNTALGHAALRSDTSGADNIAVGYFAMNAHKRNNFNTAIGVQSLYSDIDGSQNVSVGYQSMFQYSGSNNVAVGSGTLAFVGSGNSNTAIGANAGVGNDNLSFATAIGASALCDTSNSIVLGSVGSTNVSVGTTRPLSRLDVNGSIGSGIRTVTASTVADVADHTIIIAGTVGAGKVDITLPTAATCTRREYRLVNQNINTNKSVTGGYTDFTGATVTALPSNDAIVVQSDGTGWVRVL